MSLNGLDEAKVAEAHQAALNEAGGWFLVKYTARDSVDLLSRGSGGVAEVRSAITSYEEKSPLYGLVQFRRKKIILKYVPEGTSRLLQVRLTVQFQSVLETFVPHDTVLSFAAPAELTESALTSACMLHPSPMSLTSSSSSLRRQPLGEISEDAEESPHIRGQSKSKVAATPNLPVEPPKETQLPPISITVFEPVLEKAQPSLPKTGRELSTPTPPPVEKPHSPEVNSPAASTPRAAVTTPVPTTTTRKPEKSLPSTPEQTPPTTSDGKSTIPPTPEAAPELPPIQQLSNSYRVEENDPRTSIQDALPLVIEAGRPSFSNYDAYDLYKPKIKRGPRPHVEPETRPQTAGGAKKPQAQRLVANLPTSVRAQHRPPVVFTGRPDSRQSARSVPSGFVQYSEPPVVPALPSPTHISSLFLQQSQQERPYHRAGSIASTATAAATPEKLRLMKALQLRKRNQQMAKRESERPQIEEIPKTSVIPQSQTDREEDRSQSSMGRSGADSTSASRIEEVARVASPASMTNVSEVPSTQSSSFVEDNDATSHASISSDTSSSVTPRADAREVQQRKQAESSVPLPRQVIEESVAVGTLPSSNVVEQAAAAQNLDKKLPETNGGTPESTNIDKVPTLAEAFTRPSDNAVSLPAEPVADAKNITAQAPGSSVASDDHPPPVPSKANNAHIGRGRAPNLEPIKVVSTPDLSDDSDDDSFMEELQNAQVQQAKPVAVGRSPVTPIYHNASGSVDRLKEIHRAVSSPLHEQATSGSTSPDQSEPRSLRSISTALPVWQMSHENSPPIPLAKKGPLSSGISRRIKALEVFTSGRDSSSSPPAPPANTTVAQKPKATAISSRKRLSFMLGGHPPNTSTSTPATPLPPNAGQPVHPEPTDYELSQSLDRQPQPTIDSYPSQQKGETFSVTARIVRSANPIQEDSATPADNSQQLPLQRSKLTIEHDRPDPREVNYAQAKTASILSIESSAKSARTERARPSFSSNHSDSQGRLPTSDSMMSRLSIVSSKKRDKTGFPRSNSDNSSFSEEKSKQSRTRRLMQRVSNMSTNSRRNLAGAFSTGLKDPVAADTITESAESDNDGASIADSISRVVDIGDVNVQFPDTLLWKRRFLKIDDQGYLIFTPPTMERNTRNINRKFHLGEFKRPMLPDVEREEMAWSILLDLKDGSCIQCACESKYTQTQVLRMLVDAHSAYHQLYSA